MRTRIARSPGHASSASRRWQSMVAATACSAALNTDTVASPSPIDFRNRPPCDSTVSAMIWSWRTSARAIDDGSRSHACVEPSMSERQNVSTPVGRVEPHPARRRSTNSPGVAGRRAGSVASPARIAVSSAAVCSGSMPSHVDGMPVGGAPVSSVNAVAASAYTSDARLGGFREQLGSREAGRAETIRART